MENAVFTSETGLGQDNRNQVASRADELARMQLLREAAAGCRWGARSSELGSITAFAIHTERPNFVPALRCEISAPTDLCGELRAVRSLDLVPAARIAEALKYAALRSELTVRDATMQQGSARVALAFASITGVPSAAIGQGHIATRNEAAIQLIRSWIAQDLASGEDDQSWAELKQELDRDRASSRRLFP